LYLKNSVCASQQFAHFKHTDQVYPYKVDVFCVGQVGNFIYTQAAESGAISDRKMVPFFTGAENEVLKLK
jgi:hypothetical protein